VWGGLGGDKEFPAIFYVKKWRHDVMGGSSIISLKHPVSFSMEMKCKKCGSKSFPHHPYFCLTIHRSAGLFPEVDGYFCSRTLRLLVLFVNDVKWASLITCVRLFYICTRIPPSKSFLLSVSDLKVLVALIASDFCASIFSACGLLLNCVIDYLLLNSGI
jgi:hypothetical protein